MSVRYESALTGSPPTTTVDGPVTLSVDLFVSDDVRQLDIDFTVTDPSSAVQFQNGGKLEQLRVPVTHAETRIVHGTRLRCGSGQQVNKTAQIMMTISSNGVLQAPPISCIVGIASFTCAADVVPGVSGTTLSHALASMAFAAAAGVEVPRTAAVTDGNANADAGDGDGVKRGTAGKRRGGRSTKTRGGSQ